MDGGGSAGKVGGDWGEIAQNWRESQKGRITIRIQLMEMRIEMAARMVV